MSSGGVKTYRSSVLEHRRESIAQSALTCLSALSTAVAAALNFTYVPTLVQCELAQFKLVFHDLPHSAMQCADQADDLHRGASLVVGMFR
jgi:hypothetical protein